MSTGTAHFHAAEKALAEASMRAMTWHGTGDYADLAAANFATGQALAHAQMAQAVVQSRIARALERIAEQGRPDVVDKAFSQAQEILLTPEQRRVADDAIARAYATADEVLAAAARGQLPDEPPERPVDDGYPVCLCSHARSGHERDNALDDDWRRRCLTPGCGCDLYRTEEVPAPVVPEPDHPDEADGFAAAEQRGRLLTSDEAAATTLTDLPAVKEPSLIRPYLDAAGNARFVS